MNLAFDLIATQPNIEGSFHGGGKYAKKIYLEMIKFHRNQLTIFALYDSSQILDSEIYKNTKLNNIELIDIKGKSLIDIVRKYNVDTFYSALPFGVMSYGLTELFGSNCKVIVTIHGLRYLELSMPYDAIKYVDSFFDKGKFLLRYILERRLLKRDLQKYKSLLNCDKIITVSEHTKYSLLSHFDCSLKKIDVFYSPDVTNFDQEEQESCENNASLNYFLLVSGGRWIKNNIRSAIALDRLFTMYKDIKQNVIITGVENKSIFLRQLKNKDRFIFYPYVSEVFLRNLYKNAYGFIYMSLNEGFGYPPLEAMKYGAPVITSPHTSMPEVCDNAVLYANPNSISEIMSRILNLCKDNETYQRLNKCGKNRYKDIHVRQVSDLQHMIEFIIN